MTTELNARPGTPAGTPSRFGVFGYAAFTLILVATTLSSVGFAMFDTATAWLMTSLNPTPRMVSAVQVSATLPFFLLTLPAGAMSDVVDPRRLLIAAQSAVLAVAVAFALVVATGRAEPAAVLGASFLLGAGGAIAAPAWLLIAPMLVPRADLDAALAIDNATYNVARAIGPAIAGVMIARLGVASPFWVCCLASFVLLVALLWWREPPRRKETLPAERLVSAMTTGLRYVANSREMDSTLIRAAAFFPFASAYLALLPLVARNQLRNGPEVYGELMGLIGLGAIAASLALNWLKARLGPNGIAALGAVGTALALFLFALAREPSFAFAGSLIAGASWIIMLTTFYVSAQVALPEWVRGRGLAVFLTVYFGALTLGGALWGEVASLEGLPFALAAAGAGALAGLALTWRWKLQTGAGLNLAPSMHWRAPTFLNRIEDDEGPIMVIIEYSIDPKDTAAFLTVMQDIGLERKRDGAYAWHVFEDPNDAGSIVETFLIHSLLELKYRQSRLTMADELLEDRAKKLLKAPQTTRYLVAPKPGSRSWPGRASSAK